MLLHFDDDEITSISWGAAEADSRTTFHNESSDETIF